MSISCCYSICWCTLFNNPPSMKMSLLTCPCLLELDASARRSLIRGPGLYRCTARDKHDHKVRMALPYISAQTHVSWTLCNEPSSVWHHRHPQWESSGKRTGRGDRGELHIYGIKRREVQCLLRANVLMRRYLERRLIQM